MADDRESFSVPFEKLNGQNWAEWSRKLKAWLVAKGLWEATQGPSPTTCSRSSSSGHSGCSRVAEENQKALGAIVLSLEGSQLPLVEGLETAQEAYQALERVHHRTTAGAKIHTTRRLFEMKLRPGGNIRQHVTEMLSVFNELRLLQVNFSEELKVYILLSSLDKSYDNLCLSMESMSPQDLTLSYVTGRLSDEQERRVREGRSGAGSSTGCRGGGKPDESCVQAFSTRRCYVCGSNSHLKRACPQKSREAGQDVSKVNQLSSHGNQSRRGGQRGNAKEGRDSEKGDCYHLAASLATLNNNASRDTTMKWVLDSGASHHLITPSAGELQNCRAVLTGMTCKFADGKNEMYLKWQMSIILFCRLSWSASLYQG
ncbi:Retrovirus-related Pol polyprotein from transposon TNT 1-94 [Podarcis lilfordi]|uniref:Retrovirus-related Pol polyprotein from transposon TNT 1-94 n=2 Tax=Podarcis lilfordi TaxID=74358 RepID=A0AA35P2B4_9SAUR|nr:Retrovirus-related Pol polyprotein from transposon TNT 1-94 [Podarcis lilfordi]